MSAPFDMLPATLFPARPLLANALSFARHLLQSGERPGTRAWVWADGSDHATAVDALRLGQHVDDHPGAVVALRFERRDRQLHALVRVQVQGDAVELVGEAHAGLLGPWTVQP